MSIEAKCRRIAAVLALSVLVPGCRGRPRSDVLTASSATSPVTPSPGGETSSGDILEFDLTSGVATSPDSNPFYSLPASRTYPGLVRALERAVVGKAKGFLVRLGAQDLDWAQSEELGAAFGNLRKATGKPVYCHAHGLDNRTAWFTARACSRTWVSPAGDVDTVGIAGQVVYLKGALDKLKVRADFLHVGKYKSAAESITQEGPSEEARAALTAVLASIRSTWIEEYKAARDRPDIARHLEDGPWGAVAAKERGLIDEVGYEDDARRALEVESGAMESRVAFGPQPGDRGRIDVREVVRLITGGEGRTRRPHIVVIPAEGSITMSGGGILSESGITFRGLQRVIRRIAADDTVRAVVLRIDSPGGSALASDLLWHELMALRKKKPLVASVGDMAASGGYYLACASTKIVAERTSIVGSIGVVGGKIVLDETLAEYGIHAESFPASPAEGAASRAAYLSPLAPWDGPTRDKVRTQMQAVYDLFVSRVAEGRGVSVETIRPVAEGRIWSGLQGADLHLVDELGGLGKSLDIARKLGGLHADAPIQVEGVAESIVESLLLGDDADEASVRLAMERAARRARLVEGIAAPLRPFIGALSPLAEGESVVATLDFRPSIR